MGHDADADADAALPADESVPVRESSREDARVRLPLHLIAYIVAHSKNKTASKRNRKTTAI